MNDRVINGRGGRTVYTLPKKNTLGGFASWAEGRRAEFL